MLSNLYIHEMRQNIISSWDGGREEGREGKEVPGSGVKLFSIRNYLKVSRWFLYKTVILNYGQCFHCFGDSTVLTWMLALVVLFLPTEMIARLVWEQNDNIVFKIQL